MADSKTSGKRITAAERRKKAVQMRISGATYDDISKALGVSRPAAYNSVKTALQETKLKMAESVDELREIERERLERLILAVMPKAMSGDVKAVDSVRRLSESLRRLLGLDAPDKIEFNWRDEAKEIGLDENELYNEFERIVNEAIVNEKTTVSKSD